MRGARLWHNSDDGFDAWEFGSPILIEDSLAWGNAHHGFSDNGNPGAHQIDRCTAWRNDNTGFVTDRSSATLTANRAVANEREVGLGANSGGSGNSWDIGGSWPLANTDPATITGPRQPDGAIPSSNFLRQPADGTEVGARF